MVSKGGNGASATPTRFRWVLAGLLLLARTTVVPATPMPSGQGAVSIRSMIANAPMASKKTHPVTLVSDPAGTTIAVQPTAFASLASIAMSHSTVSFTMTLDLVVRSPHLTHAASPSQIANADQDFGETNKRRDVRELVPPTNVPPILVLVVEMAAASPLSLIAAAIMAFFQTEIRKLVSLFAAATTNVPEPPTQNPVSPVYRASTTVPAGMDLKKTKPAVHASAPVPIIHAQATRFQRAAWTV